MQRWVRWAVGFGFVVALTACGTNERRPSETKSIAQPVTSGPCAFSAPPTGGTVTNVTFTVKTPSGVLPADLALGSDLGTLK